MIGWNKGNWFLVLNQDLEFNIYMQNPKDNANIKFSNE